MGDTEVPQTFGNFDNLSMHPLQRNHESVPTLRFIFLIFFEIAQVGRWALAPNFEISPIAILMGRRICADPTDQHAYRVPSHMLTMFFKHICFNGERRA